MYLSPPLVGGGSSGYRIYWVPAIAPVGLITLAVKLKGQIIES